MVHDRNCRTNMDQLCIWNGEPAYTNNKSLWFSKLTKNHVIYTQWTNTFRLFTSGVWLDSFKQAIYHSRPRHLRFPLQDSNHILDRYITSHPCLRCDNLVPSTFSNSPCSKKKIAINKACTVRMHRGWLLQKCTTENNYKIKTVHLYTKAVRWDWLQVNIWLLYHSTKKKRLLYHNMVVNLNNMIIQLIHA